MDTIQPYFTITEPDGYWTQVPGIRTQFEGMGSPVGAALNRLEHGGEDTMLPPLRTFRHAGRALLAASMLRPGEEYAALDLVDQLFGPSAHEPAYRRIRRLRGRAVQPGRAITRGLAAASQGDSDRQDRTVAAVTGARLLAFAHTADTYLKRKGAPKIWETYSDRSAIRGTFLGKRCTSLAVSATFRQRPRRPTGLMTASLNLEAAMETNIPTAALSIEVQEESGPSNFRITGSCGRSSQLQSLQDQILHADNTLLAHMPSHQ